MKPGMAVCSAHHRGKENCAGRSWRATRGLGTTCFYCLRPVLRSFLRELKLAELSEVFMPLFRSSGTRTQAIPTSYCQFLAELEENVARVSGWKQDSSCWRGPRTAHMCGQDEECFAKRISFPAPYLPHQSNAHTKRQK